MNCKYLVASFVCTCLLLSTAIAQIEKAPPRKEGEGPWSQLIIRGVTIINSTGSPAIGPMDVVVENDRIVDIKNVGVPGVPIQASRRPQLRAGGKELNCE